MNDRELLELAAKASGRTITSWNARHGVDVAVLEDGSYWQPLLENQITDADGDAQRLAVKLQLHVMVHDKCVFVMLCPESLLAYSDTTEMEMFSGSDHYKAVRRAIVRCAAAIGAAMNNEGA
jgi:hypothetical protein